MDAAKKTATIVSTVDAGFGFIFGWLAFGSIGRSAFCVVIGFLIGMAVTAGVERATGSTNLLVAMPVNLVVLSFFLWAAWFKATHGLI